MCNTAAVNLDFADHQFINYDCLFDIRMCSDLFVGIVPLFEVANYKIRTDINDEFE